MRGVCTEQNIFMKLITAIGLYFIRFLASNYKPIRYKHNSIVGRVSRSRNPSDDCAMYAVNIFLVEYR